MKKGPFIHYTLLQFTSLNSVRRPSKSLPKSGITKKKYKDLSYKIWERSVTILPSFIGSSFQVHDGKRLVKLRVSSDMVGHKFGSFVFTTIPATERGSSRKKK